MYNSHLTLEYLEKYSKHYVFVETGTYLGDTVDLALAFGFNEIHSIELNQKLFEDATEKYINEHDVNLYHGDSVDIIPYILNNSEDQITFWLDSHASGPLPGGIYAPCPLEFELNAIKNHSRNDHVIFIDDVRLFGSPEWNFLQKETILNLLTDINPEYTIEYLDGHVEKDIIVAYRKFI